MNVTLSKLAKISVLFSLIPAIYLAFNPEKIVLVSVIFAYPLIASFLILMVNRKLKRFRGDWLIISFFLYNLIVFVRGMDNVYNEKGWIDIFTMGVINTLLLPLAIYFGITNKSIVELLRSFFWYGFLLCSILFFITDDSGPYGFTRMVSPIYLFILFIPYVKSNYKIIIISISAISFFSDISIRSNLLSIIICFLISFTYFWKNRKWMLNLIKILRFTLLYSAIIFFILGISGVVNIFNVMENNNSFEIELGEKSQDVFVDSRTAVYMDVFTQLKNDNRIIIGLGALGRAKTFLVDVAWADYDIIYKDGRQGTESGMLNYIQYGGLLGGFLYFLIFYGASYLAIYKSNNWLVKMIGLFVSFKGFYSFIEDSISFTSSSIFIFIAIGICFNQDFRKLNDLQIKIILNKIIFKLKRRQLKLKMK